MKCQFRGAIAAILMAALLAVPLLTVSAVSYRAGEQAPSLAGKATRRAGYSEMLARTAKKAKGKKRWLLRPGVFEHLSGTARRSVMAANGLIPMPKSSQKTEFKPRATTRAGQSTQSIAPSQNVRVNDPAADTAGHTQSETSIAVNGPNIIETYNDSDFITGSRYSFSTDGGSTFTEQLLPVIQGGVSAGDGVVALGPNGEFYESEIAFAPTSDNPFGEGMIGVAKSTDNGISFTLPVDASTTATNGQDVQDKPWITVDRGGSSPFRGNVYVTWTDFTFSNGNFINVARSTNGAASFQAPVTISPQDGTFAVQGSMPAVGPNGEVYVAFYDEHATPAVINIVKSTDGGRTFGNAKPAATLNGIVSETGGGSVRANSFPSIVVDKNGAVHVVYAGQPVLVGPDPSDVFYTRSTDGGATFRTPVRLNDDGTQTTQFLPSIAAAADGTLGVKWWDRRNDPIHDSLTDVYMCMSTDGGSSFGKNFRITDHNWTFGPIEPGFAAGYHGDYDHIAADGGNFYVSWSDERGPDADAYLALVPTSHDPGAADFNISAKKVYASVRTGESINVDLATGAINGFSGGLTFSAEPTISGLSYSFSAASVAAGSSTTLTVSATAAAKPGTYLITVAAAGGALIRRTNLRLTVNGLPSAGNQPFQVTDTPGTTGVNSGLKIDAGGAVHLVYEDDSAVAAGNQVFYTKSSDGGQTYSNSILLSTNSKTSFESEMTVDRSGNVYAVWTTEDTVAASGISLRVFLTKSTNHGASFSAPVPITRASELSVIPHIAVDASGKIVVSYLDGKPSNTPLLTVLSTDGGGTFSDPVAISQSDETVAGDTGSLVFDSKGQAYALYSTIDATIRLAVAQDGQHFAKPVSLTDQLTAALGPRMAIDAADNLYVVYSVFVFGVITVNDTLMFTKSCDRGATFSPAINVVQNPLPGDPGSSDFADLVVDSRGVVTVVWEDSTANPQQDIFYARSTDGGVTFSRVSNISANGGFSSAPVVAVDANGAALVIWSDDSTAETDLFGCLIPAFDAGPSDFQLVVDPSQVDTSAGAKGSLTVFIGRSGGFTGNVTVTNSGTPDGVRIKSSSAASTCNSVGFDFTVAKGAANTAQEMTFTGQDASGRTRTARLNLVIH
jgi:hypothetical protein